MSRGVARVTGVMACALPALGQACACGCGVFDVATAAMFPTRPGAMLFLEQDFMDQNTNWSGRSSAPAADNADKRIRTGFWTAGLQYMINRAWTAELAVPYWQRRFVTTAADGGSVAFTHAALGDVRLKLTWSGLSEDLSTGITLGVKLPSGDSTYANFDPDTEIGSGSTDLLLGGFHRSALTADNHWSWFASAQWQQPLRHKASYRPGAETDAVSGIYYGGWNFGAALHVAPLLQLTASLRRHDGGPLGHPADSGYTRAFLAPGVELDAGRTRVYADVSRAVYTNASGNQLMARTLFRINVSARF